MNLTLKYPPFNVRVKNSEGETLIFDNIRKKWFVLTPEEWVRQHTLNFLTIIKKYPASMISIEKEITLNETKKRFDILVYNKALEPSILIECKAPYIELNNEVLDQVKRYNLVIKADFYMITNGISDVVFDITGNIIELPEHKA